MAELIRDTVFGHLLRLATRGRVLQYAEQKDPSLWRAYLSDEKTRGMAHHGQPDPAPHNEPVPSSEDSSRTRAEDDQHTNEATGQRIDTEKGRDMNVVEWFDENDSENPMNWSRFKRFFVTFEICLLTWSVYIGSSIYSAGTQTVVEDFGVSQVKATLGLTLFVAGYGVGPMIWAPMSEIPMIGRNPVYIGTLVVFVVFQLGAALATNFAMLLCFRFFTGFFGSPVLATGGASIADMYRPQKRAYGIGIWGIAAVCGPVFGPLIGGFAAQAEGWTWTIWELMWLSGFCLVLLIFFLPETSSSNILYRRARRLRRSTAIENLKTEAEIQSEHMTPKDSFPIVFEGIYHFKLGQEGLAFIGILVGAILVIPPLFWYIYKYVEPQFNDKGEIQPEKRLPPAMVGGFFIPICLFWFGWSARPSIHWIMPIIGSGWFAVGTFLLFNSVLNYLGDAYPEYAASVLAGNDLMRSSFGAGFPLFATAMYNNLGVNWASSALGFLAIAFIPIPFVLYKVRKETVL
ncbi:MAG: hypothetical protein LQ351_002875 [Letrouitia transgressa]|nr:MAG: hypothetical protein LQ351_002875 [Letrouitia transgressa]